MQTELQVINEQEVLGKQFKMYGTPEEPLFVARDVAEWIEYDANKVGQMLASVDEDERLTATIYRGGQNREMWMLTENGLYEVLMQSRKPIAKQLKEKVKEIIFNKKHAAVKTENAIAVQNKIQVFDNEAFGSIRTVEIDGEPWFVAADVCAFFNVTNRNRLMQQVDADDKGGTQMNTPGGKQEMTIVNESGLYTLLFYMQPEKGRGVSDDYIEKRCAKLKAFKRWITHDVIPTIRKTGSYNTNQESPEGIANRFFANDSETARNFIAMSLNNILLLTGKLEEEKSKVEVANAKIEALVDECLSWDIKKFINAAVRRYAKEQYRYVDYGKGCSYAWGALKKEVLYKYGCNINSRVTNAKKGTSKNITMFDVLSEEETLNVARAVISMCHEREVNIDDIVLRCKDKREIA